MNLHGIVRTNISAVNPNIEAQMLRSTGFITLPDGTRESTYKEIELRIQVQALTNAEIRQLDGLNIQGNRRAVYLTGHWAGIVRADQRGGDLFRFYDKTWLAVVLLEAWPGWSKVAVVQQMDGVTEDAA